jgi:hypothetical protein
MSEENNEQTNDLLVQARSEREMLQKENDRLEKNIKELRDLEASRILGSTAGGRQEKQELPKEETSKEYAERVMRGK